MRRMAIAGAVGSALAAGTLVMAPAASAAEHGHRYTVSGNAKWAVSYKGSGKFGVSYRLDDTKRDGRPVYMVVEGRLRTGFPTNYWLSYTENRVQTGTLKKGSFEVYPYGKAWSIFQNSANATDVRIKVCTNYKYSGDHCSSWWKARTVNI